MKRKFKSNSDKGSLIQVIITSLILKIKKEIIAECNFDWTLDFDFLYTAHSKEKQLNNSDTDIYHAIYATVMEASNNVEYYKIFEDNINFCL